MLSQAQAEIRHTAESSVGVNVDRALATARSTFPELSLYPYMGRLHSSDVVSKKSRPQANANAIPEHLRLGSGKLQLRPGKSSRNISSQVLR